MFSQSRLIPNHTYSEALNKLTVLDLTIFVQIKAVVDNTELLAGQENANLGEELFKFKLGKSTGVILVELLYIEKLVFYVEGTSS